MKKIILAICIAILLVISLGIGVSAESYTHKDEPNDTTTNALSRELYLPLRTITATDLGFEDGLGEIPDMYCTAEKEVYLLLSSLSRIAVLNPDYTLKSLITVVDENGDEIYFEGAKGIFVDTNGDLYISDTENGRVLVTDAAGVYKMSWGLPDSPLIPAELDYRPTRFIKDNDGYSYIISEGCYYGALSYSPKNEFMGFFGANRVKASALNAISSLFDRLTSNDVKKAASARVLPYSFVDMSIDPNGHLTVCSGKTEVYANSKGQIRKISSTGANILLKRDLNGTASAADSVNFLENKWVVRGTHIRVQDLVAIDVDEQDFIFTLDRIYGSVYVYDNFCNLLGTFGGGIGEGSELGEFKAATALTLQGTNVLIADSKMESVTVYERTQYGSLLCQAQTLTLKGDYIESRALWEQVVAQDASCQLAYRGLANAAYSAKDFDAALKYAEAGMDYSIYDLAWQVQIKSFVANNFIWFFGGAIVLLVGIVLLMVRMKKRETALIQNPKVATLFSSVAHPFRAYEDVKYKNRGSVAISLILILLFFVATALEATSTGFLFCQNSERTYNIFYTLAQTVGLVFLWSIVNWLMCTLFSGKGSFKEVLVVTSYSLLPLIVFTFIYVGLSHILPLSGGAVLDGIRTVIIIYTFYLIAIGMMAIHEYTFPKFLTTTLVTLVCMVLAVFIIFILVILLQQFWNFLYAIFMEVVFKS